MHIAIHGLLHTIAKEHYNKYVKALDEYNALSNNNAQWDLLSHTAQENDMYVSLFREKTKFAIISVVFLVMSLEGLINEYGFVYLGQDRFMELERKGIGEKITTFYEDVTGNKFPTDRVLYQNINDLVLVRNTLVHSKSIEIDVKALMGTDEESERVFLSYFNAMIGNSKERPSRQKNVEIVLEKSHSVYVDLMKYLHENTP